MVHRISDGDPNVHVHESLKDLHGKFDKMLEHLAVIAGAVKAPEGNAPSPSSPGEADKSG